MANSSLTAAARLALPLAAAVGFWIVGTWFVAPGVDTAAISRGVITPVTWPRVMLYCAALCAAAMFVQDWRELRAARAQRESGPVPVAYDEARSLLGIATLAVYALAIPVIGMAFATFAFIAAWLVLGGLRRPLTIGAVSGIGTVALLYLFVKVSLMPLDRGQGPFEQATVALYRALGIY